MLSFRSSLCFLCRGMDDFTRRLMLYPYTVRAPGCTSHPIHAKSLFFPYLSIEEDLMQRLLQWRSLSNHNNRFFCESSSSQRFCNECKETWQELGFHCFFFFLSVCHIEALRSDHSTANAGKIKLLPRQTDWQTCHDDSTHIWNIMAAFLKTIARGSCFLESMW